MHVKRHRIVLAAAGILFLAAAPIISFVLAPYLAQLPADLDQTTHYTGTLRLPDPATGQIVENQIELERRLRVESVHGGTAVIALDASMYAVPRDPAAAPLSHQSERHAVDRANFTQAPPPAGTEVIDQHGAAVFALPPGFARDDSHRLFDSAARQAVPLTHLSSETIQGRAAEVFHAENHSAIADPGLLAQVRAGLGAMFGTDGTTAPTTTLIAMGVPADRLTTYGPSAPVTLTVASTWQISADKNFGALLALDQTMRIDAVIGNPTEPAMTTTLQTLHARTTTDITDTATTLDHNDTLLHTLRYWIPLAALALGLTLITTALIRRRTTPAPTTPVTAETTALHR